MSRDKTGNSRANWGEIERGVLPYGIVNKMDMAK